MKINPPNPEVGAWRLEKVTGTWNEMLSHSMALKTDVVQFLLKVLPKFLQSLNDPLGMCFKISTACL